MSSTGFSITGTQDIQKILEEIAPKHARNLMRATIHGVASEIAKDAKQNAPRDTGNLKKSIKAHRAKSPPDAPISEVRIKSGKGANSAFYWKFVEYGTKNMPEHPFIRPASERAKADFDKVLTEQFGKKLEAALLKAAKKRLRNGL